jgi:dihydroorotate dehydrogenase (NAD+) catalytic subunit
VITHVVGVNADDALESVEWLSDIEAVAGIELGLPDSLSVDEAIDIIASVERVCNLPLIVKLPLWKATDLSVRIMEFDGVDALTVSAPPRGSIRWREKTIRGRLYGPSTLPLTLWVLDQVASLTKGALPLIGCGGIHSLKDAKAMLNAGAVALQVDSYIWKDPSGFVQLARKL